MIIGSPRQHDGFQEQLWNNKIPGIHFCKFHNQLHLVITNLNSLEEYKHVSLKQIKVIIRIYTGNFD